MKAKKRIAYALVLLLFIVYLCSANTIVLSFDENTPLTEESFNSIPQKNEVYQMVDGFQYLGGMYEVAYFQGWAFCETEQDNACKTISLVFVSEDNGRCYTVESAAQLRPDVYGAFYETTGIYNGMNGLECQFSTIGMKNGIYKYYVAVWENETNHGIVDTGMMFQKDANGLHIYDPFAVEDEEPAPVPEQTEPSQEESGLSITGIIAIPLIALMRWCYELLDDHILAIVVFTLLSKILLMPVALWMQRSSIKMVEMMPELNQIKTKYFGDKETIGEETQMLYKKMKYNPLSSTVPMVVQIVLLMGVIEAVKALLGDSDSWLLRIPAQAGGSALLMPVAAALAALLLTLAQNELAPLQKEQPKAEQLSTGLVSVGISLFLGAFVSLGTGFYWIASNLFSIPVQVVCNWIINPKKYVDYEALERSRKQLETLEGIGKKKRESYFSKNKKRERADYKRFFSVVNKHLVFYSESNGFYKYYKGFIEFILAHTDMTIHYITSDPDDRIFELEKEQPKIRAYYIGENKLITLMMKMDADVVVMTMPDLENYHIKRSYVRDDIEYINVSHGMGSNNLTFRKNALDHFDTVFCAGVHQKVEIEQQEQVYHLPAKNCVEVGYPLIDEMRENYAASEHKVNLRKKILVAPSWQKDNIIDSCLEELLDSLKKTDCEIIVRPHPQEVRLKKEYMESLKKKYEPAGIEIQTDFTSNNPVLEADLLITDWSDISWEYAFTTLRPVMYINTPMKVMNPEWQKIEYPPLNIFLRDQLGKSLDTDQLDRAAETAMYLLDHTEMYREKINELAHTYVYNLGTSSEAGAKYMIRAVLNQIKRRREAQNEKKV